MGLIARVAVCPPSWLGVIECDVGFDKSGVTTHHLQIGVTEEFLQRQHLAAIAQIFGRKRMAQTVWVYVLYARSLVDTISPADGYELIIVPTNAQQVEAALQDLAPNSGNATFLIFSANWDGVAAYDAILPRERYLLGYPDAGGTIRDGVYWTNIDPEVHLGLLEGQAARQRGYHALLVDLPGQGDTPFNGLYFGMPPEDASVYA